MLMHSKIRRNIFICGIIGITAVIITIISDFILLSKGTDAYTFFKLNTETMAGLPHWRILWGTFLGVAVLPLQITGLIPLYYGLKPAGKIKALIVFITIAYALIIAVGFHAVYAFIGSAWNVFHATGASNLHFQNLMSKFNLYWTILLIFMGISLCITTVIYITALYTKKTLFPKWMIFLNPVTLFLFMFLIIIILPAPLGGFIAPAYLNLATLLFYILLLCTINWQHLNKYN
jgi:hypothetical protein